VSHICRTVSYTSNYRAAQVALAAGCLAAMTSLPRYSTTPSYVLLVASQGAGLAAAVALGTWQGLRALPWPAGGAAERRLVARGTQVTDNTG
jgi:hypothetical protein